MITSRSTTRTRAPSKYDPMKAFRNMYERLEKKRDDLNKRHPEYEYYLDEQEVKVPSRKRGNHYIEERTAKIICLRKRKK